MFEPKVRRVTAAGDIAWCQSIRAEVFTDECGIPKEIEQDEEDRTCVHFLASMGVTTTAAARLILKDRVATIQRVAVRKSYRRKGKATHMIGNMVSYAKSIGCTAVELSAQTHIQELYKKMGFEAIGDPYEENGIPHQKMRLEL